MNTLKARVTGWLDRTGRKTAAVDAPPQATAGLLDNIARSMGQASRRDSFRIAASGMAGIALTRMGIRNAWAGDNCLCNGQTYDPTLACCTAAGVVQKNPIANLADCPNKVANPLHTCQPNGCGGQGGTAVPNSFLGIAPFRGCCNSHDCCYDTCNESKAGCDLDLFTCMTTSCATHIIPFPPQLLEMCVATAGVYYAFVTFAGGQYYDAAQQQTCDCCSQTSCQSACAGGVCGAFPACLGGGDCVCFQTPEADGACIHGSYPCSAATPCSSSADCPPGFGCAATNCCGGSALCGPLCSDVGPSAYKPDATAARRRVRTLGGRH